MGKLLRFDPQKKTSSTTHKDAIKLKGLSDHLDQIIHDAIEQKVIDPYEVSALIAHRLGSLIRCFENKEELWEVCQKVVERQANLDVSA